MKRPATPNLDALGAATKDMNLVRDFLRWAREDHKDPVTLCVSRYGKFYRSMRTSDELMTEYLRLDTAKIEAERQALLEWERSVEGLIPERPAVDVGQGTSRRTWPRPATGLDYCLETPVFELCTIVGQEYYMDREERAGILCPGAIRRLFLGGVSYYADGPRAMPDRVRLAFYTQPGAGRVPIRVAYKPPPKDPPAFAIRWTDEATKAPNLPLCVDFQAWLLARAPGWFEGLGSEVGTVYVELEIVKPAEAL